MNIGEIGTCGCLGDISCSCPEVFCQEGVLKILQNSWGSTCVVLVSILLTLNRFLHIVLVFPFLILIKKIPAGHIS